MCTSEPSRTVTFRITVPDHTTIPPALAALFTATVAEAQLLEDSLKSAVKMDVNAFGAASEVADLLSELATITLGGAIRIAQGIASHTPEQKTMGALVGFAQLLPALSGLTEPQLAAEFSDALKRRNAITHHYLVDVIHGTISEPDATRYLRESRDLFAKIKVLIIQADFTSSKLGAVAPDGSSLPRVPKL